MDDINAITYIHNNNKAEPPNNTLKKQISKEFYIALIKLMQSTIDTINEYPSMNNIPKNIDKTHIITFMPPSDAPKIKTKYQMEKTQRSMLEWITVKQKSKHQYQSQLETYHTAKFTINNQEIKKDDVMLILGIYFDAHWTFLNISNI